MGAILLAIAFCGEPYFINGGERVPEVLAENTWGGTWSDFVFRIYGGTVVNNTGEEIMIQRIDLYNPGKDRVRWEPLDPGESFTFMTETAHKTISVTIDDTESWPLVYVLGAGGEVLGEIPEYHVPEPATMALLALGGAMIWWRRR